MDRGLGRQATTFPYRIACISDQYYPVRKANSEQVVNTVSALAGEGVDIKLIVPGKWRNIGKGKEARKKELLDFYNVEDGFNLVELPHLPFSPFKLDKLTHGVIGPLTAWASNHDIIYTRNSLPALVALRLGKRVLFEAYRIYEQEKLGAAGFLAKLTKSSDSLSIITHSVPSMESLIAAGGDEGKVRVIPNGYNPAPFTPPVAKLEARRTLGWKENDRIASYAGRIDVDKGVNAILELAASTPEINYMFIGHSQNDSDGWILRSARERGLHNVSWTPWINAADLPTYLFASDVLIIPPTAGPLAEQGTTVLPIKTFIYMAAGRSILAPAQPDIASVLNEKNAALVEPDRPGLAAKTIRRLFKDEAWARSISQQVRSDAQQYTWQNRARRIIEFLRDSLFARP